MMMLATTATVICDEWFIFGIIIVVYVMVIIVTIEKIMEKNWLNWRSFCLRHNCHCYNDDEENYNEENKEHEEYDHHHHNYKDGDNKTIHYHHHPYRRHYNHILQKSSKKHQLQMSQNTKGTASRRVQTQKYHSSQVTITYCELAAVLELFRDDIAQLYPITP